MGLWLLVETESSSFFGVLPDLQAPLTPDRWLELCLVPHLGSNEVCRPPLVGPTPLFSAPFDSCSRPPFCLSFVEQLQLKQARSMKLADSDPSPTHPTELMARRALPSQLQRAPMVTLEQ